jgi:D-alanyl-D-alanine carboxypeptidase/D-alanyl-D-alanine-endopeptidase (penicillin-binding protein 4)
VRSALGGVAPSRVIVDSTLFPGPNVSPNWKIADVNGGVVSRITALMTDGARVNPADKSDNPARYSQPDIAAGQAFAQLLGIPTANVVAGAAPAGAKVLGEVLSPPIGTIVEGMLATSDNTVAEMMGRQVALAKGVPASFDGAAQATRSVLTELGVPTPPGAGLVDGNGLSYADRVTTGQLMTALVKAAAPDHPQLHWVISGLAVAGYSGTMDDAHRRGDAGRGVVRAKTGTLTGINALVGYVVDADGRLLAFAAIANGTPRRDLAEDALDRIAKALTQCGCR